MSEFQPPITRTEIIETGSYPDGRINSLTALIFDSLEQSFTFSIATAAKLTADTQDDETVLDLLSEDHERIFVTPGLEIDPTELEEIVQGLSPELLRKYLTPQE